MGIPQHPSQRGSYQRLGLLGLSVYSSIDEPSRQRRHADVVELVDTHV
ncbi:hypothetical protein OAE76_00525 [bacterium]|nr:hypothetical protein [bacterium]